MSIVRENLLTRRGYTPYCGSSMCGLHNPRTEFKRGQFECGCGWRSKFEPEFIEKYRVFNQPPETGHPMLCGCDDCR